MSLLEQYIASGKKTPPMLKTALRHFDRWLEWLPAKHARNPGAPCLQAWREHLEREEYAPGTIKVYWSEVARVLRVLGHGEGLDALEMPRVPENTVWRPRFSVKAVAELVEASAKLPLLHQGCLAMATTYGVRRAELASLDASDFTWRPGGTGVVYIHTAKGGRERYHLVPREVAPLLRAAEWEKRDPRTRQARTVASLSEMFEEIRAAAGRPRGSPGMPETGWHSIRRGLDHLLLTGAGEAGRAIAPSSVTMFMRWKVSGGERMAMHYASTPEIDLDGSVDRPPGVMDEAIDQEAFSLNPWLPLWARIAADLQQSGPHWGGML